MLINKGRRHTRKLRPSLVVSSRIQRHPPRSLFSILTISRYFHRQSCSMFGNRFRTLRLLTIILSVDAQSTIKQCFDVTGTPSSVNFPCDPTADVSACCGKGWDCSSNLHCRHEIDGETFVGMCTDRTWKDPACPFSFGQSSVPEIQSIAVLDDRPSSRNRRADPGLTLLDLADVPLVS